MRIPKLAIWAGAACGLVMFGVSAGAPASAQGASIRDGHRAGVTLPQESSAQSRRRRAPTQLRIVRERRYLPPTAVRECNAWYEQEFRPSGTVIVPRMRCRWVAG
jgi:hypothetical protein